MKLKQYLQHLDILEVYLPWIMLNTVLPFPPLLSHMCLLITTFKTTPHLIHQEYLFGYSLVFCSFSFSQICILYKYSHWSIQQNPTYISQYLASSTNKLVKTAGKYLTKYYQRPKWSILSPVCVLESLGLLKQQPIIMHTA